MTRSRSARATRQGSGTPNLRSGLLRVGDPRSMRADEARPLNASVFGEEYPNPKSQLDFDHWSFFPENFRGWTLVIGHFPRLSLKDYI